VLQSRSTRSSKSSILAGAAAFRLVVTPCNTEWEDSSVRLRGRNSSCLIHWSMPMPLCVSTPICEFGEQPPEACRRRTVPSANRERESILRTFGEFTMAVAPTVSWKAAEHHRAHCGRTRSGWMSVFNPKNYRGTRAAGKLDQCNREVFESVVGFGLNAQSGAGNIQRQLCFGQKDYAWEVC
jgi:hypothetical protein